MSNGEAFGLYVKYIGKPLGNFNLVSKTISFMFLRDLFMYGVTRSGEPRRSLQQWSRQKMMLAWTSMTDGKKWLDSGVLQIGLRGQPTTLNVKGNFSEL